MPTSPVSRMQVVRKEEKQSRLIAFIELDLAARAAAGLAQAVTYRLIARSPDSPVVRALASLEGAITAQGIRIHALLSTSTDPGVAPVLPICTAFPLASDLVRCTSNPRLAEAHEQLLLGPGVVWIGDCMRRDPDKRDAFECYSTDCTMTADWAAKAFTRLWQHGAPMVSIAPAKPASAVRAVEPDPAADAISPAAIVGEEPPAASGATRH